MGIEICSEDKGLEDALSFSITWGRKIMLGTSTFAGSWMHVGV